jgi:flavin-dependent dehydrogenase
MDVAVVGGGFAGLSAAEFAHDAGHDVVLYDEDPYAEGVDRVAAWGGGVSDYGAVPRGRDVRGYLRAVDEVVMERAGEELVRFQMDDAALLDRPAFENAWGRSLAGRVEVVEERVGETLFWRLCEANDLVVDASGGRPVSAGVVDAVGEPTRDSKTFSAVVEGEFGDEYPTPHITPYRSGFAWVNPLSRERASVGMGAYLEETGSDTLDEFRAFCTERGVDLARDEVRVKNVAREGGRAPRDCEFDLRGAAVRLVGDAACVADNDTGTALSRSARSAELAVAAGDRRGVYPDSLADLLDTGVLAGVVTRHLSIGQEAALLARLGGRRVSYRRLFEPSGDRELLAELFGRGSGREG